MDCHSGRCLTSYPVTGVGLANVLYTARRWHAVCRAWAGFKSDAAVCTPERFLPASIACHWAFTLCWIDTWNAAQRLRLPSICDRSTQLWSMNNFKFGGTDLLWECSDDQPMQWGTAMWHTDVLFEMSRCRCVSWFLDPQSFKAVCRCLFADPISVPASRFKHVQTSLRKRPSTVFALVYMRDMATRIAHVAQIGSSLSQTPVAKTDLWLCCAV